MNILNKYVLKNGKELIFIEPGPEYAEMLVEFISNVDEESPFLGREARDVRLSVKEMYDKLESKLKAEKETYFLGTIDGEIVVECSVHAISKRVRFAHRSGFGIVVKKKYWRNGIGRLAVSECINLSKNHGYEQLELNTNVGNEAALNLYKGLGFEICGMTKNAMKYIDGSYSDDYSMVMYF